VRHHNLKTPIIGNDSGSLRIPAAFLTDEGHVGMLVGVPFVAA